MPDGAIVETGARTFALSELMVVEKFRGTGVAHQIRHELLRGRPEERVTLLVERDHPKVLPEDLTDRVTWGRRSALPEERGFTAGLAAEDVTAAPTAEVR